MRESTRGTVINLTSGQIQLSPEEQQVGDSLDELIRFAAQLDQCERQTPPCPDRDRLLDQVDVLTARYNRIVDQFESDATQARRAQDRNAPDPRSLLSEDVSRIVNAQPGTALLYPVVLEDKLLILWASSAGLALATEVPVERSKVNEAVLKFRSLMSQCELGGCQSETAIREIQEVSQQLNQWLMPADLEAALKQANITNLVFALDYTLRYIPMSALYDGQQYLIEKDFTVSTVTAAWFNRVDNPLPADTSGISVLGLGLTAPVSLNLPEGQFNFNALANVRPELNAIIRPETGNSRTTQGIYRGLELLDGQFDDDAFHQTLGRQVLHIATHGKFLPVNSSASFLVLGNQQPWRISEINNNLRHFQHLSLLVLSACETALGGSQRDFSGNQIPDGKEISGIAQTFLSAGVDTVIASLWLVNDPATRDLMQQFYSNLARSSPSNRVTISQALREAQLALLHGTHDRTASSATRSDIGTVVIQPPPDANVPRYAHPYYWSAFTIIGNGL